MAKKQRTRIDDIATVGAELSEEQMRLASGGMRRIPTEYGTNDTVRQQCRVDSDTIILWD
ncbi:MAG: hypothetical protein ACRDJH_00065 [Thermomicrobiales bacterium]